MTAQFSARLMVLIICTCVAAPGWAELPAFPGAVGQGAAAVGGRGGDVYRVTELRDYNTKRGDAEIHGSLRHAIESADGPRTIVFEVGGAIELRAPLQIRFSKLTIAGQTAPGGITVWGYPVDVRDASDIVIRFVRMRTGDFNARAPRTDDAPRRPGRGAQDLDAASANALAVSRSNRVIVDHVSTAWGMDETLSVTLSRDVTVQHSIIAESLNDSFHPKGPHGYGTLIRGELTPADQETDTGGYTFYGNLWALHRARNPSIGGQQRLDPGQPESDRRRTDVNLVNNVVYAWRDQPTHRSELGEVRINLVGNYYVNGPGKKSEHIFNEDNPARTLLFQQGNMLDGQPVGRVGDIRRTFRKFDARDVLLGPTHGEPFNFFAKVADHVLAAEEAYARVVGSAGASLRRDAIDQRVIDALVNRTGSIIDSQEEFRDAEGSLPGIDDLPSERRPPDFDTDGDGMPDEFEIRHGLDPNDPEDRNGTDLSDAGYTNLEVYLNSLVPEAIRP